MARLFHELKSWPEYFQATKSGTKTFELRKGDRDFKVGDIVVLREWEPDTQTFTGQTVIKEITYVLASGPWLQPGFVAFGIKD
jgi:hypothetical protein